MTADRPRFDHSGERFRELAGRYRKLLVAIDRAWFALERARRFGNETFAPGHDRRIRRLERKILTIEPLFERARDELLEHVRGLPPRPSGRNYWADWWRNLGGGGRS